jgi:hypothetical protein
MLGSREQGSRFLCRGGKEYSLGNWNLIKAGKKERNRNRKPYKEGRVVGVVSAVVILATIIPALPVAGAVTPVGVVALTPASVVPITPVIVAVVISVTAGMTGMDGTSLRRSNSDDGYQDKAQCSYGFHSIYHSSVDLPRTLVVFDSKRTCLNRGELPVRCGNPKNSRSPTDSRSFW